MATDDSIIVLDDDDEDEAAAQPGPSNLPSNPGSPGPETSGPPEPRGDGGRGNSGSRKCFQAENEKLFEEVRLLLLLREKGLLCGPGLPGAANRRLALNSQSSYLPLPRDSCD